MYVLAGAIVLLLLAAVGLAHLLPFGPRISPEPTTNSRPAPTEEAVPGKDALIAITEIGSTETRGRSGQKNVAVKIGVAPRPNIRKGDVEIRVSFFDLTEANEMRPTEAEVSYEWLTPVRDWTDPTPKFLVATYEAAGVSRKSADKIRYGGFVVRVYFDGELQAERSEPKALLAALQNMPAQTTAPSAVMSREPEIAMVTPSPRARALASEQAAAPPVTAPVTAAPSPLNANRESSTAVPYASPVPDKPGFVYSPHNPKFLIDVRGFPPGTEVNDPNTGKLFKVP